MKPLKKCKELKNKLEKDKGFNNNNNKLNTVSYVLPNEEV